MHVIIILCNDDLIFKIIKIVLDKLASQSQGLLVPWREHPSHCERLLVAKWLINNSMLDLLQSAYRDKHSTETAFIKVQNDMCGLLLFAMIRSVVKSFKVPDVEVAAARMSNESALTRMTDSTPKKTWSDLTLVLDG